MKNILIFLLLSISGVSSQDLSDNLLLHYEFNGNAIDSSDNDYHGPISGVIFGLDRNGNPNSAAYFDGIDDFIDLPNLTELKPDLPVSFSFWIKYDNPNYQNDWNGTSSNASVGNSNFVPTGTYYYVLNIKNSGLRPITGPIYVSTK